jgi:uncharacterized LabA/DUF88 family protein
VINTGLKIAVFVDFDNIEIGVKNTLNLQLDIAAVLEGIKERGEIVTKVAYGDWKRAGDYSRLLSQHAIRMVQRTVTPGGDKNGADINLALDALEMAFTHDHINAFVIVGGDSDFITLVEKLKQYDKKVFVVGGRQFTSLVMQRNCHEFIAYENLVSGRRSQPAETRPAAPADAATKESGDVDQIIPLVKRALKVLADREVSPQLGLLKSTLLQLDSTFSERNYGSSTFRDFVEKISKTGAVTLRQAGRNIMVDLPENGGATPEAVPVATPIREAPKEAAAPVTIDPTRLSEITQQVRQAIEQAAQPPRWPMYIRQFKHFLRANDKNLEEQGGGQGALLEWIRACQREGILRLERDRRGQMRVFPGASLQQRLNPAVPIITPPDAAMQHRNSDDMTGNDGNDVGNAEEISSVGEEPEEQMFQSVEAQIPMEPMEQPVEAQPEAAPRARRARKTAPSAGTRKRTSRKSPTKR